MEQKKCSTCVFKHLFFHFLASFGRNPISIGMDVAKVNPTPTLCDQEADLADLINLRR